MLTLPAFVPLELSWLLYLANVAAASLLVCGLALLVQRCWPNRTLPLRHLILLGGLLVTLAVPLVVGLSSAAGWSLVEISGLPNEVVAHETPLSAAPAVNLEQRFSQVPVSYSERPIAREQEMGGDLTDGPPVGAARPSGHEAAGPAAPAVERALYRPAEPASLANGILWGGAVLMLVWLIGSAWQACRFVQGLLRIRGFRGTLAPIDDPRLLCLAADAAGAVGLRRCPPLALSAAIDSPVSMGVLRGRVVLPAAQLGEWSDEAWRALLLHEMAHLRRRDLLVGLFQRVAIVLYWWNPLLRLVSARISVLREQICDDLVTQHGAREDRYAALIVELAGRMIARRSVGPVLAAADGTPSELAGRIRRLLDPSRKLPTTLSRQLKLTVTAVCVAMVVGVGSTSVRWVVAEEQTPIEAKENADAIAKQESVPLKDAAEPSTPAKKVRVTDADGKPIVGATLTPWAARSRDDVPLRLENLVGRRTLPAVTTDAGGLATVHYPRLLLVENVFHIQALVCRVEHADFVTLPRADLSLLPAELEQTAAITMNRGVQVEIWPKSEDLTFEPERLFAQWSGDNPEFKIHVTDKGLIELPRLPPGDTMFRAVYLPKHRLAMFSELPVFLDLQEGKEYVPTTRLVPGVRVHGRLDDSVPRPVTGGVVVAEVIERAGTWHTLSWRVWSKIDEDGTFLLDPVPAGDLQVIALCDGFMASHGKQPDSKPERPLWDTGVGRPQLFPVSLQANNITIEMTPTADLTIHVQNEGGQSVSGMHFNSVPGVRWWNGPTQRYCLPLYSTAERLQGLTAHEASRRTPQDFPYFAKTDASGTAVIRNLPRGRNEVDASSGILERFGVDLSNGSREIVLTQQPGGKLNVAEVPLVSVASTTTDKPRNSKPLPPPVIKASPAPTELAGVVVDEQGQPLEGVNVDAYTWFPGNETKTDLDGRFSLLGFDYGEELEVEFTKPGYSSSLFIGQKVGTDNWTIVLTQGTELTGRVLDPQGAPVPQAAVRASRWRLHADGRLTNPVWTDTTSDDEGRYRFDFEPEATYQIDVRVPGVGVVRERNVRLAAKEKKSLDLKLGAGVSFAATLHDSESGEPAAGIILWQSRDVVGTSDNQGKFAITDLVPGEYQFRVSAVGEDLLDGDVAGKFARWWSPQAKKPWERLDPPDGYGFQRNLDNLTYEVGEQSEPVEILLEPAATISGRVLDPDGNPVAGATVAPARTGSGNSLTGDTRYSTMTDDQGRFTMIAPAGKDLHYNLVAHDGKYKQWRNWANGTSENLRTQPGEKIEGVELRLTRGGTVRGRVLDAAGKPKAHVEVRAAAVDLRDNRYYLPTTSTDEDGRYELRFVSPGEQHIQAAPFRLRADQAPEPSTKMVTVNDGEAVEDVDLTSG